MQFIAVGDIAVANFVFTKDGVPTTPANAPTITAAYSNGALLSPLPAMGAPISPGAYAPTVFDADETAVPGYYAAYAYTADQTIDNPISFEEWTVGISVSGSVDVISFSGAAAAQIDDIQGQVDHMLFDSEDRILARVSSVDGMLSIVTIPVNENGATTLVRGTAYVGPLLVRYRVVMPEDLTIGAPAYWRGTTRTLVNNKPYLVVTGECTEVDTMEFEIEVTDVAKLKTGNYSLRTDLTGEPITTPNDSLTILESIGS